MNKTTVAQQAKTASFLPPPQGLLQRKCGCGNHTVAGGECAECAKNKSGLQRKLSIGASNDPLELEADRIADQMMAMPLNSTVNATSPRIQRFSGQANAEANTAPASVDRVLAGSGRPLEPALKQDMEQRFGHDFSQVRIHTGGAAEQSARDVNAHAYTVGHNIVFGAGQFTPGTSGGQRLIAHELTHVVQQSGSDGIRVGKSNEKHGLSPIPRAIQCAPDDKKDNKDAETVLGETLWAEFPSGVPVAFYDSGMDEGKRRGEEWAKQQNAIGLKGTKITADQIVFGKAIPDTLKVSPTLTALGKVLAAAVAKVPTPTGATPAKGIGPAKVAILGIFSHGTSDWCGIGGGLTSGNAAAVVKAIAPVVTPNLKVLLYSCSGARGPDEEEAWVKGTLQGGGAGSVASKVRDALVEEGISEGEVWGHTTVGHVTENFALRFFTAASGKGQEGFAYAGFYIWGIFERVNFLFQLQRLVEDKSYIVDDKASKSFFSKASNETNTLMYKCYAKANKELTYDGKNLATMAPLYPREVAKLIKDYWEQNYWITEKKEKLADKLIKDAKLKKAK